MTAPTRRLFRRPVGADGAAVVLSGAPGGAARGGH